MPLNKLISDADDELEKNNFDAAIALYRQCALSTPPDRHTLINLSVAQSEERSSFYRQLVATHPHSHGCHIAQITYLTWSGKSPRAVVKSSEALSLFTDILDAFMLRRARLTAGRFGRNFEFWDADFRYCWNASVPAAAIAKVRRGLLGELAAMNSPDAISCLEMLRASDELPKIVIDIVTHKIAILTLMRDAAL